MEDFTKESEVSMKELIDRFKNLVKFEIENFQNSPYLSEPERLRTIAETLEILNNIENDNAEVSGTNLGIKVTSLKDFEEVLRSISNLASENDDYEEVEDE